MRLLVVEDEPRLAADLRAALKAAGYAVDVAHDGAAADLCVETEAYDCVTMDLGLPRIDGLTLVGIACGIAGALVVSQLMQQALFDVNPVDPLVYVACPSRCCWSRRRHRSFPHGERSEWTHDRASNRVVVVF